MITWVSFFLHQSSHFISIIVKRIFFLPFNVNGEKKICLFLVEKDLFALVTLHSLINRREDFKGRDRFYVASSLALSDRKCP